MLAFVPDRQLSSKLFKERSTGFNSGYVPSRGERLSTVVKKTTTKTTFSFDAYLVVSAIATLICSAQSASFVTSHYLSARIGRRADLAVAICHTWMDIAISAAPTAISFAVVLSSDHRHIIGGIRMCHMGYPRANDAGASTAAAHCNAA